MNRSTVPRDRAAGENPSVAAVANEGGDLWQACRERASRELDELADHITLRYRWDDIVLPADVVHVVVSPDPMDRYAPVDPPMYPRLDPVEEVWRASRK